MFPQSGTQKKLELSSRSGEDISEEITIQNNLKKEDDPDMEMNKQFNNKKFTQKLRKV